MHRLSEQIERKFEDILTLHQDDDSWEVETDSGWSKIDSINLTIPYETWHLETENNLTLDAADTHILFDENMDEIFVKDLIPNQTLLQTKDGLQQVRQLQNTNVFNNMFDLSLSDKNHRFYTNDLLSHNTTVAAGYLLWFAMFNPDSTILVAAHIYSGAKEIMQRIRYAYEETPNHIRCGSSEYNKGSLVFDNGSRILSQATTENTGRGLSLSLIYLDEFSAVRKSIQAALWTSLSPTLSTGGKSILTSTPSSDEDQFAEIWKGANKCIDEFGNPTELGSNGYKAFKAYWWQHPDRDQAWADKEKAKIGEEMWLREHELQFINIDETLIKPLVLSSLEGIDPIERQGQIRWYKRPEKNKLYIIALDPSLGTGGDPAAIQVFESNPELSQIAEWQHNKTDLRGQITMLKSICDTLASITGNDRVYYSIENNTIGEGALMAIDDIGEDNIRGIFLSEPRRLGNVRKFRKGFNTTHSAKIAACTKLKNLIEYGNIKILSKNLISELKTFVAVGNSFAAKVGDHDDLVTATLLAVRILIALRSYYPSLDKQMKDASEKYDAPMPFICV